MTAEDLLCQARAKGASFQISGSGRINVKAPSPLPDTLMEDLRQHKADILELLAKPNPDRCDDATRRPAGMGRSGCRGWVDVIVTGQLPGGTAAPMRYYQCRKVLPGATEIPITGSVQ